MGKNGFIKTAAQWAEKQGLINIKANCEEYETPTGYSSPDGEKAFVPDVTGMRRGRKNYIEIATKTDDMRRRVSKWKLLNIMAGRKGGKLYLLAPKGHKTFTERIVKQHNLHAKVVYLNN